MAIEYAHQILGVNIKCDCKYCEPEKYRLEKRLKKLEKQVKSIKRKKKS